MDARRVRFLPMVFVLKDLAHEFGSRSGRDGRILLTLAMRPVGAFLFGRAADRWGRRPTLMVDVFLYSLLEFASAFAPSLAVLLVLRALYGVAMGGEWGVGASLTMETIPPRARGIVSGLLQSGYPTGISSPRSSMVAVSAIGWRGMFMIGVVPALLVLYIGGTFRNAELERADAAAKRGGTLDWSGRIGARPLRGRVDDGVQLLQPRHAGSVPDLSPSAASPRRRTRSAPSQSSTISARSSAGSDAAGSPNGSAAAA